MGLIRGPIMPPSSSGPPSFMVLPIAGDAFDDLLVDAALDEYAGAAYASLSGVDEGPDGGHGDGHLRSASS